MKRFAHTCMGKVMAERFIRTLKEQLLWVMKNERDAPMTMLLDKLGPHFAEHVLEGD